jgi:hypothetical protein
LASTLVLFAAGCTTAVIDDTSEPPDSPSGKADRTTATLRDDLLAAPPRPPKRTGHALRYVARTASGRLLARNADNDGYDAAPVLPDETCVLEFVVSRVSDELVSSPFPVGSLRTKVHFWVKSERRLEANSATFDLGSVDDDFLASDFDHSETLEYRDGPRGVYMKVARSRWYDASEATLSLIDDVMLPAYLGLTFSTAHVNTLAVVVDEQRARPTALRFTKTNDDGQVAVVDCSDFERVHIF